MEREPKHSLPESKKLLPAIKKLTEGVIIGVLDVVNTSSPPGFEVYLWSEYSKLEGYQMALRYLREETIPKILRQIYARKLARGILIEKQQLGSLDQFRALVEEIKSGNQVA